MTAALDDGLEQRRRFAAVRDRLAGSALVQGGGVMVCRLTNASTLASLQADAARAHLYATEARVVEPDHSDGRGDPDRWLESSPGGPAQDAFACSAAVTDVLEQATGVSWQLAGPGSWSYYRRQGHHLGVHRDLAVCDLAVITCVHNEGAQGQSGALRVWPSRAGVQLDELRRDPQGAIDLYVETGDTVVLLGGVVPHRVLPVTIGHVRVVAPLCYRVIGLSKRVAKI